MASDECIYMHWSFPIMKKNLNIRDLSVLMVNAIYLPVIVTWKWFLGDENLRDFATEIANNSFKTVVKDFSIALLDKCFWSGKTKPKNKEKEIAASPPKYVHLQSYRQNPGPCSVADVFEVFQS